MYFSYWLVCLLWVCVPVVYIASASVLQTTTGALRIPNSVEINGRGFIQISFCGVAEEKKTHTKRHRGMDRDLT